MSGSAREGTLLLADLGGYSAYLGGVELEHSHDILADLLGVVTEGLCPPLRLCKLEGDAVFCVSEPHRAIDGDGLLAALHGTYSAFARRRRTVALSSSCTCEACRRVPELDLKFLVHHGEFIEHDVAGSRELLGTDVIVAHRLMKNSVAAEHGLSAYALISEACATRLGISAPDRHVETYEDVGEVGCVLLDVSAGWDAEQSQRAVVAREDAAILFEADVPAPPQRAWEAITAPEQGMRWRVGVTSISEDHVDGERGVGTLTHCVHGRRTIEQEIVDWLPPHHYTFRENNPAGRFLWTISLAPSATGSGTHLEWRVAPQGGRRQSMLLRVAGGRVRSIMRANFDALLAHIASVARAQSP
jgi:uncharacterized protein YndB with AHSA1/START domain